jgi:uncharacterized protein YfaS (alpha-2-macroglobulin family)
VGFEVTVDDGSGQAVSSALIVRVFNPDKISLDTGGYFKTPGQPFTVYASAVNLDGEPLPDRLLTLEVTRWDWNSDTDLSVSSFQLTTGSDGQASQSITLNQTGYYQFNLTGQDERGNQIAYTRWAYVYQSDQSWAARYSDELRITAELDSYRPYETGRFFIESTFSGPALLTFERGSVIHSKVIELTAPVTMIETEIIPEFAPNVFVVVNAWQPQDTRMDLSEEDWYWTETIPDSRLRQARTELQVTPVGKTLNITITPDEPVYTPRQEATFTIQVSDEQGQPVLAELSLALVDEAIFSLSGDLSGPIFSAFYGRREHRIETFDTFAPTRWLVDYGMGWAGRRRGGPTAQQFPIRQPGSPSSTRMPTAGRNHRNPAG